MQSIDFGRLRRLMRQASGFHNLVLRIVRKAPKSVFSGFAVVSVGLFSTFPTLPNEIALSRVNSESGRKEGETVKEAEAMPSPGTADPLLLCQLRRDRAETQELIGTNIRQEAEKNCLAPYEKQNAEEKVIEPVPNALEVTIREIVKGYPIEVMAPAIAEYDPAIAGLIVGIARKESSWGERVPTKNGQDCYNYWGYKGAGSRGTGMGYGCFATPEEAVQAIGNRLEALVAKRQGSEPSRLVVSWKCGSSCKGHSDESVKKWVNDVNKYYSQIVRSQ